MDKINGLLTSGFIISNLLTNRPIEIANPHLGSGDRADVQLSLEEERMNMLREDERNMEVFVTNAKVVYGKRFVLGKLLGSGTHAKAYSVNDQITGKTYVLKCTNDPNLISYSADFNYAEVFRYTDIGSSGLVKYHGTTLTGGKCGVILMEYCEGGDLSKYLSKDDTVVSGPGDAVRQEAAKIVNENFINLLYAVALLERRRYQNLDIKPDNIFLRKNSKNGSLVCCIGDFGLMVSLDISETGGGSTKYWAPEILDGSSSSLEGRDSYALALTILEVLHGKRLGNNIEAYTHNEAIEAALEIASAHGANPIIAEILRTMCAFNVKERLGASRVVEFLESRENRERKKREEKSPTNSEPTILKPTEPRSTGQKLKDIIDNADEGLYNAMMGFRRAREVEEREEIEKEKKEREETAKELATFIVGAKLDHLFSLGKENKGTGLVLKDIEPVGGKKNGRFSNYRVFSEAMNKHLLVKVLEENCNRYEETKDSFAALVNIFGVREITITSKSDSKFITVVVMEFCRWGKLLANPNTHMSNSSRIVIRIFLQLLEAYGKIRFVPSKDDFFLRDNCNIGILERSRETKQSIAPEKGVVAVPNAAVVAPSAAVVPTAKDFVIIFLELLGSDKKLTPDVVLSIKDISLPLYLGKDIRPFLVSILYKIWTSTSMGNAIVIAKQIINAYSSSATAKKAMKDEIAELEGLKAAKIMDKEAKKKEYEDLTERMYDNSFTTYENLYNMRDRVKLEISELEEQIEIRPKQLKEDVARCQTDEDKMVEVQFCKELIERNEKFLLERQEEKEERMRKEEEERMKKEEIKEEERRRKEEEEKKIREEEERKRKEEEEKRKREEERKRKEEEERKRKEEEERKKKEEEERKKKEEEEKKIREEEERKRKEEEERKKKEEEEKKIREEEERKRKEEEERKKKEEEERKKKEEEERKRKEEEEKKIREEEERKRKEEEERKRKEEEERI
ncbi:MAG: protein kinase family protein, partial [Rickettsiales bacterium]|nr:protein kinase family protein [Rickettsiales bacterium]